MEFHVWEKRCSMHTDITGFSHLRISLIALESLSSPTQHLGVTFVVCVQRYTEKGGRQALDHTHTQWQNRSRGHGLWSLWWTLSQLCYVLHLASWSQQHLNFVFFFYHIPPPPKEMIQAKSREKYFQAKQGYTVRIYVLSSKRPIWNSVLFLLSDLLFFGVSTTWTHILDLGASTF